MSTQMYSNYFFTVQPKKAHPKWKVAQQVQEESIPVVSVKNITLNARVNI